MEIMQSLIDKVREMRKADEEESHQKIMVNGREGKIIMAESMADLFEQCLEENLEMPSLPELAIARIDADLATRDGRILWKYNWMTGSALARVSDGYSDEGVFIHYNPFKDDKDRILAYRRHSRSGGVPIDYALDYAVSDCISSEVDGKNIVAIPFWKIQESPRGVIKIEDVIKGGGHVVARLAFGNDMELLVRYIDRYIEVMKRSPFNPLEIGIWFSEDAVPSTMRPFELGDSGIGIYNRNLTNKEYRAIGLKK